MNFKRHSLVTVSVKITLLDLHPEGSSDLEPSPKEYIFIEMLKGFERQTSPNLLLSFLSVGPILLCN